MNFLVVKTFLFATDRYAMLNYRGVNEWNTNEEYEARNKKKRKCFIENVWMDGSFSLSETKSTQENS